MPCTQPAVKKFFGVPVVPTAAAAATIAAEEVTVPGLKFAHPGSFSKDKNVAGQPADDGGAVVDILAGGGDDKSSGSRNSGTGGGSSGGKKPRRGRRRRKK